MSRSEHSNHTFVISLITRVKKLA
uniref:Uncharacterized protein n=1 Tax=Anguilla anguilla TaxID=7936 RepID=A0A0E9RFE4_ANGAN